MPVPASEFSVFGPKKFCFWPIDKASVDGGVGTWHRAVQISLVLGD